VRSRLRAGQMAAKLLESGIMAKSQERALVPGKLADSDLSPNLLRELAPLLKDRITQPDNAHDARALKHAFELVMPRMIEAAKMLGLTGVEALMRATDEVLADKGPRQELYDAWIACAGDLDPDEQLKQNARIAAHNAPIDKLAPLAHKAVINAMMELRGEFSARKLSIDKYQLGTEAYDVLRSREDYGVKGHSDGSLTFEHIFIQLMDDFPFRGIRALNHEKQLAITLEIGGEFVVTSGESPPRFKRPDAPTTVEAKVR